MQPPASTKPVWSWKRGLLIGVSALVGTFAIGVVSFMALMPPDADLEKFTERWMRFSLYPGVAAFAASWLRQTGSRKLAFWLAAVFAALALALLAIALRGDVYRAKGPWWIGSPSPDAAPRNP